VVLPSSHDQDYGRDYSNSTLRELRSTRADRTDDIGVGLRFALGPERFFTGELLREDAVDGGGSVDLLRAAAAPALELTPAGKGRPPGKVCISGASGREGRHGMEKDCDSASSAYPTHPRAE